MWSLYIGSPHRKKTLYARLLSPIRATCPTHHHIIFHLMGQINLVRSTDQCAPPYVVFSTPLIHRPS